MRSFFLLFALMVLTCGALPARAADLAKIDRTIAKEPAYKSKPKYCLLVFGLEAKARAWIVIDGTTLYVDRNCNGDLTGAGKQVDIRRWAQRDPFKEGIVRVDVGDITEPDGKTKHTGLRIGRYVDMNVSIQVGGQLRWYAYDLVFADQPKNAPILHFGGLLTFGFERDKNDQPRGIHLVRGESCKLEEGYLIGTPGVGKNTFAYIKAQDLPDGVHAQAEIEFPGAKLGDKPLILKVPLKPDN